MPNRRWLTALAIVSVYIGSASSAEAQDETPTAVTDQNRSGDLPFSGVIGSDIEHVVVTTGNLVVNIPIADLPGRGGRFHFALRYDGRYLVTALRGNNYIWNISRANYLPSNGLWQTNVPLMTYTTYTLSTCGGMVSGRINGVNNFILLDRDGAYHPVQTGRESGTCGVDEGSWSYTNRGPDTTGAGIWAGVLAIGHSNVSPGPAGLFLADGSQPGYSSTNGFDPVTSTVENVLGNIQDPNGNIESEYSGGEDTLGRVIVSEQDNTNQIVYTVKDSSGSSQAYTVNLTNLSINTQFGVSGAQEYSGTRSVVSSIVLPNSREYSFSYDNYGSLKEITLPAGGTISYTWGNYPDGLATYRYVTSRTVTVGSQVSKWTFLQSGTASCSFPNPNSLCDVVTVTDPLNNQTVYQVSLGVTVAAMIYQGTAGGTPLRQYTLTYTEMSTSLENLWLPTKVTTQLDNGQVSEMDYQYDSFTYTNYSCNGNYQLCAQNGAVGSTYSASRGNVTDIKQYDWGQGSRGPLLREEKKTYLNDSNSNYLNSNIVDKVLVDTTYDGSGNQVAQTQYVYDNYTGSTAMVTTSNAPQHDYTNFSSSNIYRGNATQVERWRNTDGALLTTSYTYDDLGNIRTIQDPLLNSTNYFYTDSFANTACPPPTNSLAYVSKVTNALSQNIQVVRYPCTGLVQAHKDQNDINASRSGTTYTYDLLGRMTQKNLPTGGQVTTSYNDVPPISSTSTTKITASLNLVTTTERDGLGRVTQTQLNSDPEGVTYVDTTYDLLGRKSTVSNPHRSGTLPTDGTTSYFYDPLNRSCVLVPPDGTMPPGSSCPTGNPGGDIFTTYSGNTTITTDQAGKTRKSATDGLGRLETVWEDPNGLNYETDYKYDALSNLISVVQNGSRQRTFVYNSLSQLTSATNPESGQISYTYDKDGNLQTKVAPAPNQSGTTTVTTTYAYEQLNRLTGKSYSNSDPTVTYAYDQPGCLGLSACDNIGHRTSMTDAAGSETWSFSVPLSTEIDQRTTGGIPKTVTDVNNLDGSQATINYPSSRVVTYTPGAAGRALAVKDTTNNYVTGALYAPPGLPSSFTNGASLVSTFYYDKRLQPCRISAKNSGTAPGSCVDTTNIGNVLDFSYNFSLGTADNGDVTGITNNRFPNRSQSFTYDSLNRMVTAETTATHATDPTDCWGEAYLYDNQTTSGGAWGNLTSIGAASSAYTGCTQEMLSVSATAQNQFSGYGYDSAGNMTQIPNSGPTYVYNAEGQLTSTSAGVSYKYDGDGKRVSKSNGKIYWYRGGSDPIAETDGSGNTTDEYIFFSGKRIARSDASGNVVYYMADHIGTSRVVASATGAILDQSDFYPFGGERVITSSSGNTYKFTGKERDSESGLDNFGARYNASSMGRFMTPDPKSLSLRHLFNPQKLNKYSYVVNNPMSFFDPNGMEEVTITYRTFIPASSVTVLGKTNGGDNRGFSTDANASSRTSISIRIETDPKIRPGDPIISVDGKPGQRVGHAGVSTVLDKNGNVTETATATTGLPTAKGTRDANGTPVINIQQDTPNPLSPGPQTMTPGISANLNVMVYQDASVTQVTGTAASFPASELNVTREDGATTPVIQFMPPPNSTPWSLLKPDRDVNVKKETQQ